MTTNAAVEKRYDWRDGDSILHQNESCKTVQLQQTRWRQCCLKDKNCLNKVEDVKDENSLMIKKMEKSYLWWNWCVEQLQLYTSIASFNFARHSSKAKDKGRRRKECLCLKMFLPDKGILNMAAIPSTMYPIVCLLINGKQTDQSFHCKLQWVFSVIDSPIAGAATDKRSFLFIGRSIAPL